MYSHSPKTCRITGNSLGKNARLKQRKLIDALFQSGKSLVAYPYRFYFRESRVVDGASPRVLFGVGVSKRYFKKAVDRNRIKRLTREVYRLRQAYARSLAEANKSELDLFVIYTGKELPTIEICEKAMEAGLQKLIRTIGPKS